MSATLLVDVVHRRPGSRPHGRADQRRPARPHAGRSTSSGTNLDHPQGTGSTPTIPALLSCVIVAGTLIDFLTIITFITMPNVNACRLRGWLARWRGTRAIVSVGNIAFEFEPVISCARSPAHRNIAFGSAR